MGRLFGTDGIRGVANADLSTELADRLAVDRDAALEDQLLAAASRTQAGLGQDLLEPFGMARLTIGSGVGFGRPVAIVALRSGGGPGPGPLPFRAVGAPGRPGRARSRTAARPRAGPLPARSGAGQRTLARLRAAR